MKKTSWLAVMVLNKRSWVTIAVAALGLGMAPAALADEGGERDNGSVLGSWYINVHVTNPSGLPDYDALYAFAKGGVFTRIDGRNNAPGVGTWEYTDDHEVLFSSFLFNFPTGQPPTPANRDGAIMAVLTASVDHNGNMTGTFVGYGILGLTNFYRAGTFTGVKIQPDGAF